jgi:subtilisin family serine protease
MRPSIYSKMLRSTALAAVACTSIAHAQDITTTSDPVPVEEITTPLAPRYGNLNPFYGDISPFYGTINPFYGDIGAFWGTINPFYGDIGAFWGTINPFYGDIGAFDGTTPAYGDIGRYWEDFGGFWKETAPLWDDPLQSANLGLRLTDMITRTELLWGSAVMSATGKTFLDAVATPLFAKYGIDPKNATTLQRLSAEQRAQFFLDWYDGLMGFSGTDRVDHWMRSVNWTPSITQQQGSGTDSIIGLLDATATGDPDLSDNIVYSGGDTATVAGHGVGVASLMVAAHDRQGTMGIAPNARVVAFNPFDSTNTASFKAVKEGVIALAGRGASVINMSLGVPGYTLHPDWKNLFSDPAVVTASSGHVAFVMAAGNDGKAQSQDILWDWSKAPPLIIVGSVDTKGKISSFSNTPGTACLLDGAHCHEANRLMNIFMVAPGELMLLPDGQGTSFAAPLVSGAITLLHDRWPWLAKHPNETVDIILRSARDLGEPGVDPVYGRGMLDVAASQSPLSFDNLKFYEVRKGVMTAVSVAGLKGSGGDTTWEAEGVYFHLYEPIGASFRDFTVPLSSALVGKVGSLTGASEYFQQFIEQRLKDWIGGAPSFTDVVTIASPNPAGWQVSVSATSPATFLSHYGLAEMPRSSIRFAHPENGFAFSAGVGEGGMALNSLAGLGLTSDYNRHGGVNPLLGLATGGSFANVDVPLGRRTTVSVGYTMQHLNHSRAAYRTAAERSRYHGIDSFKADAVNMRVTHRPSDAVTLSASYARVNERNGFLGVQSRFDSDLDHGAVSDTLTAGAALTIGGGYILAASASTGRTRSGDGAEQGLSTKAEGVLTSAFAIAGTKKGIFGSADLMRISVSQPLHVERGALTYRSVQVVNRQTGELGLVDQTVNISGDARNYTTELLYAAPILRGEGEVGLFGRAELQSDQTRVDRFAAGARLGLAF